MKHFWVVFKLMLLLVFALRLLKSNRKVTNYEHNSNRGFFNLFQKKVFSEKIQIEFESATPDLQLKEIFRKNIRPKEENWKQNGSLYDDFFASLSIWLKGNIAGELCPDSVWYMIFLKSST